MSVIIAQWSLSAAAQPATVAHPPAAAAQSYNNGAASHINAAVFQISSAASLLKASFCIYKHFAVGLNPICSTMKFFTTLFLFCLVFNLSKSQSYLTYAGARSSAMSDATVTVSDVFATFSNQACLAELEKPEVGASILNRFTVKELNTEALAFALPLKNNKGVFGLSLNNYGYNLFNRKKVGLAYAKKLSNVFSAGVQVDYLNTKIGDGYGSKSVFTVEAGVLARITDQLKAGVHIFNPISAKLANYDNEHIPILMQAGLSYKLSENIFAAAEVFKPVDEKAIYKFALEYNPVSILYLRGGVSSDPVQFTFGLGLKFSSFYFDISSGYYEPLGYSPSVGLRYAFK